LRHKGGIGVNDPTLIWEGVMRGSESSQSAMFSYVSLEERIPEDHPLREIRKLTDKALSRLSRRFTSMYAKTGRPSIPPEQLLRGLLLQALYTIRSERQLMEQLEYNLLFRWFVGLEMDDRVWSATVYTKNRDRLLRGDVAQAFFTEVVSEAQESGLLSEEHFTVDGTLIEAWASHKSFQPKDDEDDSGGDGSNFHGSRRKNDTHESKTDPDSRLFRKGYGKEAKLSYMGHVLMENRNGLVVNARLTQATGRAEWEAALEMAKEIPGQHRVTLGADKGYDTAEVVDSLRELGISPHVARKRSGSAIDDRTTRHEGYEISQLKRKLVEPVFGWLKAVGNLRKTRHRGRPKVGWMFLFGLAAYNLVRIGNLRCAT
jgi:transposase